MGANSVTGTGQGSAEGPFRSTTTLGTYRKITGINSVQIADGSIINEEFQRLSGVTGNLQEQIDEIASYVAPQNIIPVSPNATIKSIAEACDSITDSSENNKYVIQVSPGIYEEPLIEVPDFVYVVGNHIDAVVIEPDSSNHHVFSIGNRSGIANLSIGNSGSGYAGIYSYDIGNFSLIHKVSIYDCSIGVLHLSNIEDSYLFLEYVDFTDCTTNSIKVSKSGSKECELFFENLYIEHTVVNPTNNILIDGICSLRGSVGHLLGANTSGNGLLVTNGGRAMLNSVIFRGYNRRIYADTSGSNPRIELSDVSFGAPDGDPNNIDMEIANTTATGNFSGYSDYEKTIINASNDFFVANKDRNTIVVAKKGGNFDSVKDAVDSITDSSSTNRYIIYVGPGGFTEDTIELKDFVSIYADVLKGTSIVLKESPTEDILIKANGYSTITNVLLSGNGAGSTILKYNGNELRLDGCRFTNADVAIDATEVSGSKVNYPNKLTILESCLARPGNVETVFKFSDDGTQPLEVVISGFIDIDSISKATNIAEIGIVTGGARGTNTRVAFNGRSYSSWLDRFVQFWHCSRI
jgi:hypothetical protein